MPGGLLGWQVCVMLILFGVAILAAYGNNKIKKEDEAAAKKKEQ